MDEVEIWRYAKVLRAMAAALRRPGADSVVYEDDVPCVDAACAAAHLFIDAANLPLHVSAEEKEFAMRVTRPESD